MKKFIFSFVMVMVSILSFTGCSKDEDELFGISEDNSPCYIDYFMKNYYDEYYYEGKSILDKRDVKKFEIRKYESSDGEYCLLLTIDYYERNNNGYISSILNTLGDQIIHEFNSDDYLNTPGEAIQVLCKHPHCLKQYSKYNSK